MKKEFELPELPDTWINDMRKEIQPESQLHFAKDQMIEYALASVEAYKTQLAIDEPVAYLKFYAYQQFGPEGYVDGDEGLEVCQKGEIGMDKVEAFPVYTRPQPPVQASAQSVAVPDEPVAEVVNKYGDPAAFAERELSVNNKTLQSLPIGSKLYSRPQLPEQTHKQQFSAAWKIAQSVKNPYNDPASAHIWDMAVHEVMLAIDPRKVEQAPNLFEKWTEEKVEEFNAVLDKYEQAQTVGNLTKAALGLYKAPFTRTHGYIFDADHNTVADKAGENATLRIRGWGRISHMANPEQLQDKVGDLIVEALNEFWTKRAALAKGGA